MLLAKYQCHLERGLRQKQVFLQVLLKAIWLNFWHVCFITTRLCSIDNYLMHIWERAFKDDWRELHVALTPPWTGHQLNLNSCAYSSQFSRSLGLSKYSLSKVFPAMLRTKMHYTKQYGYLCMCITKLLVINLRYRLGRMKGIPIICQPTMQGTDLSKDLEHAWKKCKRISCYMAAF